MDEKLRARIKKLHSMLGSKNEQERQTAFAKLSKRASEGLGELL